MPEATHHTATQSSEAESPRPPRELPHGLLKPPGEVLRALARERAKFPPEAYGPEFEERTRNEWTVDYTFGHLLGYHDDVLYRPTPEGPDVLAVGTAEILEVTRDMSPDERAGLKTWTRS